MDRMLGHSWWEIKEENVNSRNMVNNLKQKRANRLKIRRKSRSVVTMWSLVLKAEK